MVILDRRNDNRIFIRMVTFLKIAKIEKRIFWILAICWAFSLTALADNEISIEQTGDNLDLEILQVGADNIIKMKDNDS